MTRPCPSCKQPARVEVVSVMGYPAEMVICKPCSQRSADHMKAELAQFAEGVAVEVLGETIAFINETKRKQRLRGMGPQRN